VRAPARPAIPHTPHDARACFTQSIRIYNRTGMEGERARTLRIWAAYEQAQGDSVISNRLWTEAHEIFTRLGMALEAERTITMNLPLPLDAHEVVSGQSSVVSDEV